jgi:hypothetical protein
MVLTLRNPPHLNPRLDPLSEAQRLRWVLAFLQRDLDTVSSEVLEALGDDLRHATAPEWVHERWCAPMPAEEVRALQQEIREKMAVAMDSSVDRKVPRPERGFVLPEPATYIVRIRVGKRLTFVAMSDEMTDRIAILTGVVNLLVRFSDRLLPCPVCGAPFLRQYRQGYCGVKCSTKIRNRRRLDKQKQAGQRKPRALAGAAMK